MKKVSAIFFFLFLGTAVYYLLSPDIYLFNIFSINHSAGVQLNNWSLPVRNYVPDLCWAIAVNQTANLLATKKYPGFYIYSLLSFPFLSEILQYTHLIPGTFDMLDVIIYIVAFSVCFKPKLTAMQNKSKHFIGSLILAGFIFTILACASTGSTHKAAPEKPGWYGVSEGWNNWTSDIDGKIGYQLYVGGPRGKCLPSHSWTANVSVVSGSFPPGVSLSYSGFDISGTPTDRGHWIVKLRLSNIQCGGSYYKDFEQELRFHITGSGTVHD